MKRKGAFDLGMIPQVVVVLGVIAIVVGLMATVLDTVQDTESFTGTATRVDSNTITASNTTDIYFADYDSKFQPALECTGAQVYNATWFNVSGQYKIMNENCTATLSNKSYFSTASVYVNYTLKQTTYGYGYNITEQGLESQETLSGWQATWAIIIAAAVVLGIVSAYLIMRR